MQNMQKKFDSVCIIYLPVNNEAHSKNAVSKN